MTISFPGIPASIRTPLFLVDLDNSQANGAQQSMRALLIGQMLPSGTATPGVPVLVSGGNSPRGLFGKGSMLAEMVPWYRKRDSYGEVWALPVLDNPAGTAAVYTATVTGPATGAGTVPLYIGGRLIQVPVAVGQTAAQVATAIAAAVNADAVVAVTATVAAAVVTLTANHKGLLGNDIDLQVCYGGEYMPAGLSIVFAETVVGTANPVFDDALANIGDNTFDFPIFPYTDTASLNSLDAYMAERWAWDRMKYGGAFSAARGTVGALTTLGTARNGPHVSILGFNASPTPVWAWAANYAGAAAVSLRNDPGLPLQTLALDVLPAPIAAQFNLSDRNVLLWDGISTTTTDAAGQVRLETCITTYQRNSYGDADDSYLYVERLFTLAYAIRYLRGKAESKFGRVKLADDGTVFRAGSAIVTPKIIRASILADYRDLEADGIVQDYADFAANLVIERNSGNRCRVDGILPIVPIDQLRQLCMLVQFRNSTGV